MECISFEDKELKIVEEETIDSVFEKIIRRLDETARAAELVNVKIQHKISTSAA